MKIYHTNDDMFKEWVEFLEKTEDLPRKDLPICLNKVRTNEKCIVFNTEQNTVSFNVNSFKDNNIVEVWDYSLENIRIFNLNGLQNVKYVPFRIWDEYKNKILSYNVDNQYDYDVVFVGWISERRDKILEELKSKGIKVLCLFSDAYGEKRDRLIAKSKILLNIHYGYNYNIFEIYRCFPWIGVNKTIVSENSLDNNLHCYNVDYNDIVKTIENLLIENKF